MLPKLRAVQEEETLRLIPAEAARLQAFPDDFPWHGSRTSVFRQIGNAVPPPLAMAVAGAAADRVWQVILDVYLRELYSNPLPHR
jgi:DNA (cytosine-5)-methyltransferase 1